MKADLPLKSQFTKPFTPSRRDQCVRSKSIVVIGPAGFGRRIAAMLPPDDAIFFENTLEGIWEIANSGAKTAIFSAASPELLIRAIETVRELDSNVKLVVVVPPTDEPHALRAVQRGADEYLLEPVNPTDLQKILSTTEKTPDTPRLSNVSAAHSGSAFEELAQVARILESLNDEPEQTLCQLAELVRSVFRASSASILWDGHRGLRGDAESSVVQEPLRRDGKIIGEIALGAPALGTYGQDSLKRLPEIARLVELILNVAGKVDHLAELACTDQLSGLNNRRHFDEQFAALLEEAAIRRAQLTVFLFDIDEFKLYNDKHGHHVGDELIREVAKLLTASSRESDIVARYGGDEFAVIFWEHEEPRVAGSKHPSHTEVLAQRFCKVIQEHKFEFLGPAAPGPVTISGGLASFPWDGRTVDELIRAADDALLLAKKNGKNRIQIAGSKACGVDNSENGTAR